MSAPLPVNDVEAHDAAKVVVRRWLDGTIQTKIGQLTLDDISNLTGRVTEMVVAATNDPDRFRTNYVNHVSHLTRT